MKITISQRKRADIMPDMMGLFFEDINYAADGLPGNLCIPDERR